MVDDVEDILENFDSIDCKLVKKRSDSGNEYYQFVDPKSEEE